jgi:predicted component of type VI protein secretion system
MRTYRSVLLAVAALALVAGCGSSKPVAGAAQAKLACASTGAQAAADATQAAAMNPKFATLATDEQAQAASEATTASELSDGSGDDSGNDALAGTEGLTTTGSFKIIGDCVSLGLPVTQK